MHMIKRRPGRPLEWERSTDKYRIRELRVQRNMTVQELADRIGVTKQTMGKYETGKIRPPVDRLEKIAKVLKVNFYDLFTEPRPKWDLSADEQRVISALRNVTARTYGQALDTVLTVLSAYPQRPSARRRKPR